ncbi:amidase family protein [Nocardioides sp. TF02-7]|uniref:amidase family protein n=1 Tax=Nocardioides sp. TF02-7 TaxID=2917724 RepID=UPI001F0519C9|nr:amidase family protein [Nocardioides sp. TF02-7]UMG91467.1 amidase family protein [Nocardioides sp. TF02-7]
MTGFDTRVWRERGDPLVAGAADGPLVGETVAVKDLFAVAGFRCGAGNPTLLAEAHPASAHAPVVARLLAAGASVRGIAQTDELAYSLAGTNHHHGTPPNPAAPGRVPGGSSSGPASAVALGEASIGLGTDTGGSVRVPAAYQGLFGIRTTHGAVDREGLVPLAPDVRRGRVADPRPRPAAPGRRRAPARPPLARSAHRRARGRPRAPRPRRARRGCGRQRRPAQHPPHGELAARRPRVLARCVRGAAGVGGLAGARPRPRRPPRRPRARRARPLRAGAHRHAGRGGGGSVGGGVGPAHDPRARRRPGGRPALGPPAPRRRPAPGCRNGCSQRVTRPSP